MNDIATVVEAEVTTIPLNELVLSDLNMRREKTDAKSDKRLKASLLAFGVLQNFVVHEGTKEGGKPINWGVAAGGRRLRLLEELREEQKIPADYPVPCRLVEKNRALAASIAENTDREELHPADEFVAFKRLIDAGSSIKEVAVEFGVGTPRVKQRLSLGAVHPDIIAAYRQGKIGLQAVEAYTLEPDQEKQFECFKGVEYQSSYYIREYLVGQGIPSTDAIVKFIGGVKAYRVAGGAVKQDLFESGSWLVDRKVINELAREKIDAAVAEEQAKGEGWKWVDYKLGRPDLWHYERLEAELAGLPDEIAQKRDALLRAIDVDEDKWDEKIWEAQDELDELENGLDEYRAFTPDQKERSGVLISIDYDGELQIHRGLVRPGDRKEAEASRDGKTAAVEKKGTYSQALTHSIGLARQQAFKAALARDPDLVHLLLCFRICDAAFYIRGTWDHFVKITSDGDRIVNDDSPANQELSVELPLEWNEQAAALDRFNAFRQLSKAQIKKLTIHATLRAVSVGVRGENEFADAIIDEIEVPFAELYTPTADNFFKRVPKRELLEIIKGLGDEQQHKNYSKAKKSVVATALGDLFGTRQPGSAGEQWCGVQADKLKAWVPEGF